MRVITMKSTGRWGGELEVETDDRNAWARSCLGFDGPDKGRNIKMLRSAPARTREGGRRRSAPGLQLNLIGPEGFATMKLFFASAADEGKLRLQGYESTSAG